MNCCARFVKRIGTPPKWRSTAQLCAIISSCLPWLATQGCKCLFLSRGNSEVAHSPQKKMFLKRRNRILTHKKYLSPFADHRGVSFGLQCNIQWNKELFILVVSDLRSAGLRNTLQTARQLPVIFSSQHSHHAELFGSLVDFPSFRNFEFAVPPLRLPASYPRVVL